jgi:hypothetical protein
MSADFRSLLAQPNALEATLSGKLRIWLSTTDDKDSLDQALPILMRALTGVLISIKPLIRAVTTVNFSRASLVAKPAVDSTRCGFLMAGDREP